MSFAYTMASAAGGTDALLRQVAKRLIGKGYRAGGVVQINTDVGDDAPCDMDVEVLPDGPILRISQNLGKDARGCRLDADALETAAGLVEARLSAGVDFLIINKFGKHEADGRGLRNVIAMAVSAEIPVLVGTNILNKDAFVAFTQGLAQPLQADEAVIIAWFEAHIIAAKGNSAKPAIRLHSV